LDIIMSLSIGIISPSFIIIILPFFISDPLHGRRAR
jgi:hypothetical protein